MNTTLNKLKGLLDEHGMLAGTLKFDPKANVTPISGADCDSRVVAPGHLFICKGAAFRPSYLVSALKQGAVAYLCDESHATELSHVAPGIPALIASDEKLRSAMALVSAEAWGHPDHDLTVIGITGTKGKSTVSYMLRAILDAPDDRAPRGKGASGTIGGGKAAAQHSAAIIGSIQTFDGIVDEESHNTTPESPDLWRHIANAHDAHLPYLVMEVSSQALKYDRVDGLKLDVAAFLNIGRDHISPAEHPNFEDYFASKLRIFDQGRIAVVNLDSDHLSEILERARSCERVVTFSAASGGKMVAGHMPDVWCEDITSVSEGLRFVAHTPSWSKNITLSMPGLFNVDNALAAIAISDVCHIGQDRIAKGLAHTHVPGRMELLPTANPNVTGIVDYAHNKLSYQRFFDSVSKEFPGREIIAVFGAPGGKAYERRRELPEEASHHADVLIYTEEDPGPERTEDICAELAAATPKGQAFEVIPSRPDAIERAVEMAFTSKRGAVVCLLAKGDETRQHEGSAYVASTPDGELFRRSVARHLDT